MPTQVETTDGTIIEFENGRSRVVRLPDDPGNTRELEARLERAEQSIKRLAEGQA